MIGHLFRIVWNRRRANTLITLELLISFVGLCAVVTMGCNFLYSWSRPLGFEYEDVWRMDLVMPRYLELNEDQQAAEWERIDQLNLMLENRSELASFSPLSWNVPFAYSSSLYPNYIAGVEKDIVRNEGSPELLETLGLQLIEGRFLEEGDEALDWMPVVLTKDYAALLFGDASPIGKPLPMLKEDGTPEDPELDSRIVGVVETYRKDGEINPPKPADFVMVAWGPEYFPPDDFVLKVKKGTPAVFEEELIEEVARIAPEWTVNIIPLEVSRGRHLKEALLGLLLIAGLAFFMIVMVGLGLVGVLWQSVTRRTEEIGLRRAMGASKGGIRRQVLGELLALTTVAVVIGTLLYIQFPLLNLLGKMIPGHVYAVSLGLSLLLIYGFVALCGLYPSWLATRVQPAEALGYE
jgi:putative ABC transport system permease protein